MPVVFFTIPEGRIDGPASERLLQRASETFADILESPVDRIRAYIKTLPGHHCASGGVVPGTSPFFEFMVLEGRPLAQRQELMKQFSEILAEEAGIPLSQVRGMCRRVPAEEWCIAGKPASEARAAHVSALQKL